MIDSNDLKNLKLKFWFWLSAKQFQFSKIKNTSVEYAMTNSVARVEILKFSIKTPWKLKEIGEEWRLNFEENHKSLELKIVILLVEKPSILSRSL